MAIRIGTPHQFLHNLQVQSLLFLIFDKTTEYMTLHNPIVPIAQEGAVDIRQPFYTIVLDLYLTSILIFFVIHLLILFPVFLFDYFIYYFTEVYLFKFL